MAKSKKRKVGNTSEPQDGSISKPKFDKTARKRQRVALDQLGWKAVDVPTGLEDYEGFFGLEEVEDVEVVKQDGRMTFQVEGDVDTQSKHAAVDQGQDDEEEWKGFSSDDETTESKPPTKPNENFESSEEEEEEYAKAGKNAFESTVFSALDDEPTDDGVDISEWDSLDLSPELLGSLSKMKFSKPTPIQASAVPEILAGRDVIGKASTGSGKTLAYGLPIIESFLKNSGSDKKNDSIPMAALIIAPTRELAHQISSHLTAVGSNGSFESPRIATITGGLSVQKQERQLSTADIVIGTPGRLWEVMTTSRNALARLKPAKYLVLDEADRLLSEGHFIEVEEILGALDRVDDNHDDNGEEEFDRTPPPRQTLVFSATFHKGLQKKLGSKNRADGDLLDNKQSMEHLMRKLKFRDEDPKFLDMDPASQMATGINEGLVECVAMEKVKTPILG